MEQNLTEAICGQCEKPFLYVLKRKPRLVCDHCRVLYVRNYARTKRQSRRRMATETDGKTNFARGVTKKTYEQLAKEMGVHPKVVEQIERDALLKIRKIPQLKELWNIFKEDGCRVTERDAGDGVGNIEHRTSNSERRMGGSAPIEPAAQLLDYQMGVVDFCIMAEDFIADGAPDEGRAVLKEAKKIQNSLTLAVSEAAVTTKQKLKG